MTDTFTWRATIETAGGGELKMSESRFGDGYRQLIPEGINPDEQKWNVMVMGNRALVLAALTFIREHAGISFFWKPPLGMTGYYLCKRYNPVDRGGGWWELSLEFEQTYQP